MSGKQNNQIFLAYECDIFPLLIAGDTKEVSTTPTVFIL